MKKFVLLLSIFLGLFMISGCQSSQTKEQQSSTQATSQQVKSSAVIKLIADEKTITSKTIDYQNGESLLAVLKQNFAIKEKNGFITSIDDHNQDESNNKYWTFTINGNMSEKGAADTKLENKDKVVFTLGVYK